MYHLYKNGEKIKMLQNQLPVGILKVDYDIALESEEQIDNPVKAIACIQAKLQDLSKECACVLCLDNINRPICVGILGYGTNQTVEMDAKEIMQFALLTNACGVILMHNHPNNGQKISGLSPSSQDIELTKQISHALNLFNINLHDHLIFNCLWKDGNRYPAFYSMRSKGIYKNLFKSKVSFSSYNLEFSGDEILKQK